MARRGAHHRFCLLAALWLGGVNGCAHRVALVSEPAGAQVRQDRKSLGNTPLEVVVWSFPIAWKRPEVRLSFPGYRPVVVDLSKDRAPLKRLGELLTLRWRKALALVPSSQREVLMTRRHGPVGSWEPEDVD